MSFRPKTFLTVNYVLSQISEEDLFERYLGIYPIFKEGFCNPYREDDHGDCYFYTDNRNRLKFRDIAAGWNWDCFNVIEYAYDTDLKGALQIIANDFGLEGAEDIGNLKLRPRSVRSREERRISEIRVKRRDWAFNDLNFWKAYEIQQTTLDYFDVAPAQTVWLDGRIIYNHNPKDPCFIYHLGGYDYKLYFPYRERGRFLQVHSNFIEGWNQLPPEGEFLLITKSLKDVMCLYTFNIPAVAPPSESVLIPKDWYIDLYNRFDVIYTLFDFDRAGVRALRKYNTEYEVPYLLFDSSYKPPFRKTGIKDFSDHVKERGINETIDLIEYVKGNIIT